MMSVEEVQGNEPTGGEEASHSTIDTSGAEAEIRPAAPGLMDRMKEAAAKAEASAAIDVSEVREPGSEEVPPKAAKGAKVAKVESAPNQAEYMPNFNYTVMDEKHEFDKLVQEALTKAKSPEVEAKIRELYEKAHGIEVIKTERQKIREEFQTVKSAKEQTDKALGQLSQHVRNKDFDSFFSMLKIPQEDVLRYALTVAQRTPEQQAQLESQRESQVVAETMQRQTEELSQRQQQFAVQQRTFELNLELSKPEVSSFSQMFDAKVGKPGAFREEVIKRGQLHSIQGRDISADEAVAEVVGLLRPVYGEASETAPATKIVTPNNKPTLPNMPSSGTSSVRPSRPKSLKDLRQRAEQVIAAERL